MKEDLFLKENREKDFFDLEKKLNSKNENDKIDAAIDMLFFGVDKLTKDQKIQLQKNKQKCYEIFNSIEDPHWHLGYSLIKKMDLSKKESVEIFFQVYPLIAKSFFGMYHQENRQFVANLIKEKCNDLDTNYFIKECLELLVIDENYSDISQVMNPKKISGNVFLWNEKISNDDFQTAKEVERLTSEYEKLINSNEYEELVMNLHDPFAKTDQGKKIRKKILKKFTYATSHEYERVIERHFTNNFSKELLKLSKKRKIKNFDFNQLKIFYKSELQQKISDDLKIDFLKLSFPVQFEFLSWLKYQPIKNVETIKRYIKKYSHYGLITFLSLGKTDSHMGDKIIELGNRLPENVAKDIFAKYAELVDTTDSVAEYVHQFQKTSKDTHELQNDNQENKDNTIAEISEKLLIRAKDVLVRSIDKSPEEILNMLDAVKVDAELFKSTFIIERKNGGTASLENLRNVQFENKKSHELNDEEKNAMRKLYAKNYEATPELQKKLLESFESALTNKQSSFYLFKFKGEIKGFDRFDDLGDGKKYFGSFNIDETMQGATLGEAMIEQSLNSEAKDYEILAESNAVNRIGARYIESGFIATGFIENYHGIPVFSIIRNDSKIPKLFKTKNMNAEDLISLEKNNRKDIVVTTASSQQGLLESFKRVGHEYVLTRYFQDKKTNQWVAVMEQVQPEMLL